MRGSSFFGGWADVFKCGRSVRRGQLAPTAVHDRGECVLLCLGGGIRISVAWSGEGEMSVEKMPQWTRQGQNDAKNEETAGRANSARTAMSAAKSYG